MTHFETVTCSRCGGSGQYSYCQQYGTMCFKCSGKGIVYTARGLAAKQWFDAQLSKPASQLQAGDKVYMDLYFSRGWSEVESVTPDITLYNGAIRPDYVLVSTKLGGSHTSQDTLFRVAHTAEQKQAVLAKALEYQASLTKAGTVRKRNVVLGDHHAGIDRQAECTGSN